MEISCYISGKVVKTNRSESLVRMSEMHFTLISRKHEVHVIPEVRDYTTLVVCKNSLTNFDSVSNPTLVINKYSDIIPCKFKVVKFTLE